MTFNIEKIYDSDAIDAGRNFHVRVFPKINNNFQNLQNGILTTFLPLSGGTMLGNLYVPTLSAATYYSGGTPLETIISSLAVAGSVTYVQNGLNTYTGGSVNAPSVNVSGLSIDNIAVSGAAEFNSIYGTAISATTFYSGSTNLNDLLGQGGGPSTFIQDGLNTYTGGTTQYPSVNVSGLSIDNIFVSGASQFNSIYGTVISAVTFYSGSTNLNDLLGQSGGPSTFIQDGLNTYTGGTTQYPTVNVSGLSIDNIVVSGNSQFNVLSATTYYSGGTPLEQVITSLAVMGSVTYVQNGLNTYTGGSVNTPSVNVSGLSIDNIYVSGASQFNSISATTFYSGSTNLNDLLGQGGGPSTFIQNGLNTYTGGTTQYPSVNVSGLSIDNIYVSGNSQFNVLSATTYYSGGTPLESVIENIILAQGVQSYNVFILTAGTLFTFSGGINHVSVNKSIGSNTQIVLSSSPNAGDFFSIKDRKGDCFFYPIVVSGGTYTIDGNSTVTLKLKNKPSLKILFDGEEYILI